MTGLEARLREHLAGWAGHKPTPPIDVSADELSALLRRLSELEQLRRSVESLDFSDAWTFDNADPGELISVTRTVEHWREIRDRLAALSEVGGQE